MSIEWKKLASNPQAIGYVIAGVMALITLIDLSIKNSIVEETMRYRLLVLENNGGRVRILATETADRLSDRTRGTDRHTGPDRPGEHVGPLDVTVRRLDTVVDSPESGDHD